MGTHNWRLRAACAAPDVNPEWFYTTRGIRGGSETYYVDQRKALAKCGACPVQAECLKDARQEAKVLGGYYGIRAGMTPKQLKVGAGIRGEVCEPRQGVPDFDGSKHCEVCSAVIAKPPKSAWQQYALRRFCSHACADKHRTLDREERSCEQCGDAIPINGRTPAKYAKARFCSHTCYGKSKRRTS